MERNFLSPIFSFARSLLCKVFPPYSVLDKAGDAEQAEGFHRRALRAREIVHGPNHPDVPILLSNLAGTLYVQVGHRKRTPETKETWTRLPKTEGRHCFS